MAKKKETKDSTEKKDRVRVIPFQRQLSCTLTREELLIKADQASRYLAERDSLEAEMKAEQKRRKAQIDEVEARLRRTSREVGDRAELRLVQCERHVDWTKGTVSEIRTDTGEEISTRRMSEDELQKELDFGDGDVDEEFGGDDSTGGD